LHYKSTGALTKKLLYYILCLNVQTFSEYFFNKETVYKLKISLHTVQNVMSDYYTLTIH